MPKTFEQCGKSNQIRLQRAGWRSNLVEQTLCCLQVTTLHTCINDGIVRDGVVGHTLNRHLPEKCQGAVEVFVQTMAFDERCVEDGVAMFSRLPHAFENNRTIHKKYLLCVCVLSGDAWKIMVYTKLQMPVV